MARGFDPIEDAKVTVRPPKAAHVAPPSQTPPSASSAAVGAAPAAATPVPKPPAKMEPAPTPKERYRVMEQRTIFGSNGALTTLAKDSIVGPHTHDMAKLREQKVKLEPLQ